VKIIIRILKMIERNDEISGVLKILYEFKILVKTIVI
jgi:hypothetical protein